MNKSAENVFKPHQDNKIKSKEVTETLNKSILELKVIRQEREPRKVKADTLELESFPKEKTEKLRIFHDEHCTTMEQLRNNDVSQKITTKNKKLQLLEHAPCEQISTFENSLQSAKNADWRLQIGANYMAQNLTIQADEYENKISIIEKQHGRWKKTMSICLKRKLGPYKHWHKGLGNWKMTPENLYNWN